MRWVLCGISFALAVALAIGTAAIRADNIRERHRLERELLRIQARQLELQRLSVQALERATPERLAANLRVLMKPRKGHEVQAWQ